MRGKPLVLIVDDEPYIAELLAELLDSELGCRVQTAFNGYQALRMVETERPLLLITDLMMPYMDGRTLIATLRDEMGLYELPIITMSAAYQCPGWIVERGLPFIAKPFDADELVTLIRRYLVRP